MTDTQKRIRDLQFLLGVKETGRFDVATLQACIAQIPPKHKVTQGE